CVPVLTVLWVWAVGSAARHTRVLSQVVLSFGIPFALIPLVWFTSRRDIMGVLTNRRHTTVVASIVAAAIVCLNVFLLVQTFGGCPYPFGPARRLPLVN